MNNDQLNKIMNCNCLQSVHSSNNKNEYLKQLEHFVDGDIIINEINNSKKYVLFAFEKKYDYFSILAVGVSLVYVNLVKYLATEFNEYVVEEDLGIYQIYSDVNG